MAEAAKMAELLRGEFCESVHFGHAVVMHASGEIVAAYGAPDLVMLPRSSSKMIQALPLVESGAFDALGLSDDILALACASHNGAAIHTEKVASWLAHIGLSEADLQCGCQPPKAASCRAALTLAGRKAGQLHNNCSGKHTGFLSFCQHMKLPIDSYISPDSPLQKQIKECFEDITARDCPGFGIDGCSAPNFATSLSAFARALAFFAAPPDTARGRACAQIVKAMKAHPLLVAGEGRACSQLIMDLPGSAVVKTGAEGVFAAILPEQKLGIALKIADGATRAAELAITALLVKYGGLDAGSVSADRYLNYAHPNWRGIEAAFLRPCAAFYP